MGVEGIGYNDEGNKVDNELVDLNNQEEKEVVEAVNRCNDENNQLAEHALENLSDKQLAQFLSSTFLEGGANGGVKRYRECISSGNIKFLEFSLRAALQLIQKKTGDTHKYTNKGEIADNDANAKTIDDRLKSSGGITVDGKIDETIVNILQKLVNAEVDGKPGPQTIVKTVLKLGGNVSQYYQQVNTLYKGNSKYEIKDVKTFNNSDGLLNGPYSYDSSKIESISSDNGVVKLKPVGVDNPLDVTIDSTTKVPSLEGYVFKDGWVSKEGDNPNPPANLPPDTEFQGTIESPNDLYQIIKAGMEEEDLSIPNLSSDDIVSNVVSITEGGGNDGYGHAYNDFNQIIFKSGNYVSTRAYSLRDFLNGDGNFNKQKRQNMLPEIKSELRQKALAIRFAYNLRDNISYDINLFNKNSDNISDYNRSKLVKYFRLFENGKVKVDTDGKYTHANGDSIKFDLDNIGLDKSFNKNLSIDPLKIEDGNGNFVEEKFKYELKNIILNEILPQFS